MDVDRELFQAAATITAGIFQSAQTTAQRDEMLQNDQWKSYFLHVYRGLREAAFDLRDETSTAIRAPIGRRNPGIEIRWD